MSFSAVTMGALALSFSPSAGADALRTSYCCKLCPMTRPQVPTTWTENCHSVCQHDEVGDDSVVECDLDRTAAAEEDAMIVVVHDPAHEFCPGSYCGWGVDAAGTEFRCSWNTFGDTLTDVVVKGSSITDYIFFEDDNGHQLDVYSTFPGSTFRGRVLADTGTDWVIGSGSTDGRYVDLLSGGAHTDHICADAGDDIVKGDAGDDWLCGDEGNDKLEGGAGQDDLCGNDDADMLLGGAHEDRLDHGNDDPYDVNDGGEPDPGDTCNAGTADAHCTYTLTGPDFCTSTID